MGKKKDLSNLLSKKVNHNNNRKRHNQYHRNNGNLNSGENNNSQNENNSQNKGPIGAPKSTPIGTSNNDRNSELDKKAKIVLKLPLKIKIVLVALFALIPFMALMLFVVLFSDSDSSSGSGASGISFGGYHEARCNEITVIFEERDDNGKWNVTGTGTYSMEDYLAGVVYAEVGGAWNMEVYKTLAVAARTFVLDAANDDCSISGTAKKQAFKDVTDRPNEAVNMIYQAVQETEGEVLYQDGKLYPIQYDAFCYIDKDSNYYTLSQQNQKIPTDWVEENVKAYVYKNCPCNLNDKSMTKCWENDKWQDGGHGRGLSQVGTKYLVNELGYTYKEVLEYYYGSEGLSISTPSFEGSTNSPSFMTSVAGLEIKNTSKATKLNQPLNEVLSSAGSSIDDMNNFIHNSVIEKGAGTREGVVTAAVSMINYLYDNFNIKLPYYWGGKYQQIGISPSFGIYSPSTISRAGTVYNYKSFDCSGFVSWAIKNGGYNFDATGTSGFNSRFSKNSCNITESSCIGQPGDLINSAAGHVELIIAVDQESGKYFIAHSGNDGVVMTQRDMHKKNYGITVTKILHMDEFYNNQQNVNPNY